MDERDFTILEGLEDGKFDLCCCAEVNGSTLMVTAVRFFLKEAATGEVLLDGSEGIRLRKSRILDAKDSSVMNVLRDFDITISRDQLDMAWDKCLELLENRKNRVVHKGMSLQEVYSEMIEEGKKQAFKSGNAISEPWFCRIYDNKFLDCTAAWLETFLKKTDSSYSKKRFIDEIEMLEEVKKVKWLIHDDGRRQLNVTIQKQNFRLYRFVIDPKSTKEEAE